VGVVRIEIGPVAGQVAVGVVEIVGCVSQRIGRAGNTLLKKLGVSVYSITEQTDSDTPHGFLLEGMLEVISEFYNMNLASETRKGMVENAKRGFHYGGSPPYGYRIRRRAEMAEKEKTANHEFVKQYINVLEKTIYFNLDLQ
jgi:DNA invertase Pin-like site-specific DNA recombinase